MAMGGMTMNATYTLPDDTHFTMMMDLGGNKVARPSATGQRRHVDHRRRQRQERDDQAGQVSSFARHHGTFRVGDLRQRRTKSACLSSRDLRLSRLRVKIRANCVEAILLPLYFGAFPDCLARMDPESLRVQEILEADQPRERLPASARTP